MPAEHRDTPIRSRRSRVSHGGSVVEKIISVLAIAFIIIGLKYLILLVAGTTQTGFVVKAQERYALPTGIVYSVEYEFFPPGQRMYKGDGAVSTPAPPTGGIPVRYLAMIPEISHPGSDALLAFYAAVLIVPGLLLFWSANKAARHVVR